MKTCRPANSGQYFDPASGFASSPDDRLGSEFTAVSGALFGELNVPLNDDGELTIGLRLERRDVDYRDSNDLDLTPAETMLGGELSYSHRLSDGVTAYATLSRGIKAGGFNLGIVPAGQRQFEQEAVWSVETGLKSVLAGGELLINVSGFYSLRRDQQVETSFQPPDSSDPTSFVFFTDNAAEGKTVGLEADLRWQPLEQWDLYASIGVLDAEFSDYRTPLVDLEGRDQAHAPRYTAAIGGRYRHTSGLFAQLDFSAKDAFFFDVGHNEQSESYVLANVRVGYTIEQWSAQLYARNLFDREYAVRGFYFGNEPPDFPNRLYIRRGDPRQIGLSIEKRFGE